MDQPGNGNPNPKSEILPSRLIWSSGGKSFRIRSVSLLGSFVYVITALDRDGSTNTQRETKGLKRRKKKDVREKE